MGFPTGIEYSFSITQQRLLKRFDNIIKTVQAQLDAEAATSDLTAKKVAERLRQLTKVAFSNVMINVTGQSLDSDLYILQRFWYLLELNFFRFGVDDESGAVNSSGEKILQTIAQSAEKFCKKYANNFRQGKPQNVITQACVKIKGLINCRALKTDAIFSVEIRKGLHSILANEPITEAAPAAAAVQSGAGAGAGAGSDAAARIYIRSVSEQAELSENFKHLVAKLAAIENLLDEKKQRQLYKEKLSGAESGFTEEKFRYFLLQKLALAAKVIANSLEHSSTLTESEINSKDGVCLTKVFASLCHKAQQLASGLQEVFFVDNRRAARVKKIAKILQCVISFALLFPENKSAAETKVAELVALSGGLQEFAGRHYHLEINLLETYIVISSDFKDRLVELTVGDEALASLQETISAAIAQLANLKAVHHGISDAGLSSPSNSSGKISTPRNSRPSPVRYSSFATLFSPFNVSGNELTDSQRAAVARRR
jgi:hypothetical protein